MVPLFATSWFLLILTASIGVQPVRAMDRNDWIVALHRNLLDPDQLERLHAHLRGADEYHGHDTHRQVAMGYGGNGNGDGGGNGMMNGLDDNYDHNGGGGGMMNGGMMGT